MPTDTQVNDLKINVLSEAQYEQIASPSTTELYLVPEVVDTTPTSGSTNPITSGGVYTALQNIPAQEQSDWNETDTTDPAYIKNKPTIPAAQVNSDWNASSGVSQILNKPTLFSGSYNDLDDKPVGGKDIEIKPLVPETYAVMTSASNNSDTYIDTGIVPDVDDIEIELVVDPTTASWYILQSRPSGGSITGISGSSTNNTIIFTYCGTTLTSGIARTATGVFTIRAKAKSGNMSLYVKNHSDDTEDTQTGTYTYTQHTLPFWMFGNQNGDRLASGNHVMSVKIWKSGSLVLDYVPVKLKSNDTPYFYDTKSERFITATSGSLYFANSSNVVGTPVSVNSSMRYVTIYSGSSAPSSGIGNNGDIYIQTAS